MQLRNTFLYKNLYRSTSLGRVLMYIYHSAKNNLIPDAIYVKRRYKELMGKSLNLKNPKTLNEKISWLKIYDRTTLHTKCADKYGVRDYIEEKIGEHYLVPLYFHSKNPNDINPKNIVEFPCIVKANHDSSGGIFLYTNENINWSEIQKNLKIRLQKNYYPKSKEWQYKNIEPRIIVEKLLQNNKGEIPLDYKLHCFNGNVNMIQVDIGRGTKNHFRNWYDCDWTREPYRWSSPKENGTYTDPSDEDVEPPESLAQMIELSEILSQAFDYVRVDWYDVDGKLYFGELTFHHDGGNKPILPEEWDRRLGERLKINVK